MGRSNEKAVTWSDCEGPSNAQGAKLLRTSPCRGAPRGERTEKELISAFCDKIAELSPQLVTFNGNSFDLPCKSPRAPVPGNVRTET